MTAPAEQRARASPRARPRGRWGAGRGLDGGALKALELELGVDVREFDVFVGTSAGSVLGVPARGRRLRGRPVGAPARGEIDVGPLAGYLWDYDRDTGGDRPGLPSRARVARAVAPQRTPAALAAAHRSPVARSCPRGGAASRRSAHGRPRRPDGWAGRGGCTVVALDYDTGERVAFGREGAPEVDLLRGRDGLVRDPRVVPAGADRRAPLHRRRRVVLDQPRPDGRAGLDEVFVLAPQVSFVRDAPKQWRTRVERQWRNRVTLRVLRELGRVHADGAEVTVLGPGEEDLEAFGWQPHGRQPTPARDRDLPADVGGRPARPRTTARPLRFREMLDDQRGRGMTQTRIYVPLTAARRPPPGHGPRGRRTPVQAFAVTERLERALVRRRGGVGVCRADRGVRGRRRAAGHRRGEAHRARGRRDPTWVTSRPGATVGRAGVRAPAPVTGRVVPRRRGRSATTAWTTCSGTTSPSSTRSFACSDRLCGPRLR